MAADAHEDLDERLLHRLLFFTDAVFAIVLTLLVLELRPPEVGVDHPPIGRLFAFGLSFSIIGIFWVAHMATTRRLAHFDWPTAIVNLVFLFPVCLIPFVSAWVGEAVNSAGPWAVYSLVLIGVSLGNMLLVLVQSRGGGRLLAGEFSLRERGYRLARSAAPGLAFAVGFIGATGGRAWVAQYCWVLIPVFMMIFRLTLGPKRRAVAA